MREGLRITEAYQVCVSMQEEKTRQRELEGIRSAMKAYSLSEGYIITREETEDVKVEEGVVHLVSFARWIL